MSARRASIGAVPLPLSCPGSLLPVPHLQLRDDVACEFCRLVVMVVAPPVDRTHDS